jgi:hypothetical protein
MALPNLKKLIKEFVDCGQEVANLEKEYQCKVSNELTIRYANTFKALVEERARQNKIN